MPILEVPLLVIINFMKLVFFKYHNLNKFDQSKGLKCYNGNKGCKQQKYRSARQALKAKWQVWYDVAEHEVGAKLKIYHQISIRALRNRQTILDSDVKNIFGRSHMRLLNGK